MAYLHGDGWDVPLIDLTPLNPQPRSRGMQTVLRSYAASYAIHEQGYYIDLEWSAFESPEEYQSLLGQIEMLGDLSRQATLWLPDPLYVWRRYNAILQRPDVGKDGGRENFFLRDFTVRAVDLRVLV